jgi:hypothetical protein
MHTPSEQVPYTDDTYADDDDDDEAYTDEEEELGTPPMYEDDDDDDVVNLKTISLPEDEEDENLNTEFKTASPTDEILDTSTNEVKCQYYMGGKPNGQSTCIDMDENMNVYNNPENNLKCFKTSNGVLWFAKDVLQSNGYTLIKPDVLRSKIVDIINIGNINNATDQRMGMIEIMQYLGSNADTDPHRTCPIEMCGNIKMAKGMTPTDEMSFTHADIVFPTKAMVADRSASDYDHACFLGFSIVNKDGKYYVIKELPPRKMSWGAMTSSSARLAMAKLIGTTMPSNPFDETECKNISVTDLAAIADISDNASSKFDNIRAHFMVLFGDLLSDPVFCEWFGLGSCSKSSKIKHVAVAKKIGSKDNSVVLGIDPITKQLSFIQASPSIRGVVPTTPVSVAHLPVLKKHKSGRSKHREKETVDPLEDTCPVTDHHSLELDVSFSPIKPICAKPPLKVFDVSADGIPSRKRSLVDECCEELDNLSPTIQCMPCALHVTIKIRGSSFSHINSIFNKLSVRKFNKYTLTADKVHNFYIKTNADELSALEETLLANSLEYELSAEGE